MAHTDHKDSLAMQVQRSLPSLAPTVPKSRWSRRFRYPSLNDVEDVHLYQRNGHHPIAIGDIIQQRYRIVHKLGSGGFGLVWLARDLTQRQYVALKILRGDTPEHELTILEYLRGTVPSTSMAHLRDTFKIRGVNGTHRCLVIDFVGPSLRQIQLHRDSLSMTFRKVAIRKLAEGLASLHAASICHGDLTDTNVLFQIQGIHDWTEDEIYQRLGPVKMESLLRLDGTPGSSRGPKDVVEPLDYSSFDWTKLSPTPLLADFGEAFFIDEPPECLGSPPTFAAPERLFGYSPSRAVDLWALGCLIYEVATIERLLPLAFNADEEGLAYAADTVGTLPQHWRSLYYDKTYDLKATGFWFNKDLPRSRSFDILIPEKLPNLSLAEQTVLVDLLSQLLVFEPSHRLQAAEVLKHTWFTDS